MKQKRNTNVNQDDLNQIFKNLDVLEKLFIKESKIFLTIGSEENGKGSVHQMDLFVSAVVNRGISLSSGFKTLALNNNYICAIPLIRLQIDNCLRFYASTLVTDYNDFFMQYLSGKHIRNIKDAYGNKMTDNYLAKKLDKDVFPGILNMYQNTSGHVHFSNEHTFMHNKIEKQNDEEMTMRTVIGKYDFFKIDQKVDFAFNMFKATEFLLELVKSWKYQKHKIETGIKNNTQQRL
ncbi:hypothetical protein [Winogradskyella sp.]|uniref:hypothetical protein n=1 Tax=Winogradskyella sp. TaxID=1883156 RepID=UPI0035128DCE